MGWNGEGLTKKLCPKCGYRLNLMSGAWSEQPPDAFELSCDNRSCDYTEELDYDLGEEIMLGIKIWDDEKEEWIKK